MSQPGLIDRSRVLAPGLYRRYLAMLLEGARAEPNPGSALPVPPLDVAQTHALMTSGGHGVVTGHRQVPGHLQAVLGERVEHPEGTHGIAGEDGRHGAGPREEVAGGVVAAALGGRRVQYADLACEPVPVHGGLVALDP